jgi:hypothetical protein
VLPAEVTLVLDDYHLADGPGVQPGMSFLLDHLTPQVRLVISTRADPALPLARLRARGDLTEVRAADLRFTTDEAGTYLNDATGLTLTAGDVAALQERTQGWVAALQLAALSLQGRDDASGFIAGFAGDDRYVVDLPRRRGPRPAARAGATVPAPDLRPGTSQRSPVRRSDRRAGRQGIPLRHDDRPSQCTGSAEADSSSWS